MPKKKTVIEQPINLTPDVQVIVRAPRDKWPVINWNGGFVSIAVAGAEVPASVPRDVKPSALAPVESNGPTKDTPELAAAKARLAERHPNPKKPFTSAAAFAEMGMEFDEAGLESFASMGDTVV